MKKVKITLSLVMALLIVGLGSSCSKKGGTEVEPTTEGKDKLIANYVSKKYEEQVTLMNSQLKMYENQSFRLSGVVTIGEDGVRNTQAIMRDDCAYYRKITILGNGTGQFKMNYTIQNMEGLEGCPVYKSGADIAYFKSDYADYKVLMNFPDTKNLDSFEAYKGVLQLMEAADGGIRVYAGVKGSDGNFKVVKEYWYAKYE